MKKLIGDWLQVHVHHLEGYMLGHVAGYIFHKIQTLIFPKKKNDDTSK